MTQVTINGEQMTIGIAGYMWEGNTAITVSDADGMPYAHVTTNFPDIDYPSDTCFILEPYADKNLPVVELIDAGIIEPLEQFAKSGFNMYRMYKVLVCLKCASNNLGYVPMSMVSAKTRKCLDCKHEWKV